MSSWAAVGAGAEARVARAVNAMVSAVAVDGAAAVTSVRVRAVRAADVARAVAIPRRHASLIAEMVAVVTSGPPLGECGVDGADPVRAKLVGHFRPEVADNSTWDTE